ncbi:hypothetical protein BDF20DRAFT_858986 [Mycotypha africana]|uniref:uncharacterized protein n=1 Tax=Mycotypha africana TaxID=64632 RepID=UPI002301E131|nr:uncharacterized protein BDF20DRAFT_858986 [Mycotypha africana]KAI8984276.1 hypothetical protein BDF20DRAFT_858986 [Mycotypha africana]
MIVSLYSCHRLYSNSSVQTTTTTTTTTIHNNDIKPLDLSHGQCTWCGKYGHQRKRCPYLR